MKKQMLLFTCLLIALGGCSTVSKTAKDEQVRYALVSINQTASLYIEQETSVYKMIVAASQDGLSKDEKAYIKNEIQHLSDKSNVTVETMKKSATHEGLTKQASADVTKVVNSFTKAFEHDQETMLIEFDYMSGNTEKELEANDARNKRAQQINEAVKLLNQTLKEYTSQ